MSKGNTFENDFLRLIAHGTGIPNLADNAASSPLTVLWFALHTGDPGEGGTQSTNEHTYPGYARASVARSAAGLSVTDNVLALVANLDFPPSTGSGSNATHWSLGVASSGASRVLWKGAMSSPIVIVAGTIPRLNAGTICTED